MSHVIPSDISLARNSYGIILDAQSDAAPGWESLLRTTPLSGKQTLICVGQQPSLPQQGWQWWGMSLEWRELYKVPVRAENSFDSSKDPRTEA